MSLVGSVHLVAGASDMQSRVIARLREEGIETESNPDLYVRSYAHFGIDEARELRDRAALLATGERRVFVIESANLTTEAQNALLKTFEEPPGNALFFLIVASPDMVLPTLRSRMQMLHLGTASTAQVGMVDPHAFLHARPAQRLEMLAPLLEKGDDERRDMSSILIFLSSLEGMLKADPAALEPVYRAKKYVHDKGALVKPLLEQVAILVPVIS